MAEQPSSIRWRRAVSVLATAALTGGLVALTATPAQAQDLTVNSTADTTTVDGTCTLREAITNANADADTTGGDCPAGNGADAITFAPSVTGTITLGSPLPSVTDAAGLTIIGPGASLLRISGNGVVGVFRVEMGAVFQAGDLTLADGYRRFSDGGVLFNAGTSTLTDIVATGSRSDNSGGAVENRGVLTVVDSSFTYNTATAGGGAIRSGAGTTISISGSTFSSNLATRGGAIESFGETTVATSVFSGNAASLLGGAVRLDPFNLAATITDSTFDDNVSSGSGGAIRTGFATGLVVERSTFSGNETGARGGAIDAVGPLSVASSTFSGNTAWEGGAIGTDFLDLPLTIRNSTFADNVANAELGAASLHRPNGGGTVTGSILSAPAGQVNCLAPAVDGGANIDSGTSCEFGAPVGAAWGSDVDPLLGPLADNGGLTETLLPQPGSPALDAIDPGALGCPGAAPATGDLATDQRGVIRPQGPKCDLGAVEVEAPVVYTVSPFGKPVSSSGLARLKAGDTLPLKFTVTDDTGALVTDLTGDDVTVAVRLATTCGGAAVVDLSFAAGSALQLRLDGSYQVDLKTQRSWAGYCGTVTVTTPNGGEQTADLQFSGGGRGRG